MKLPYEYTRSRRSVATRMLLWVAVLWGYVAGMALWDRIPNDGELFRWGLIGFGTASVVLLGLALRNLLNPGRYRVKVDQRELVVEYPGNEDYSYQLPVAEIARVEHRTRHDHAGRRSDGHWVVTRDGSSYPLTQNYFSSAGAVTKALQAANPAIESQSVVDRRPF